MSRNVQLRIVGALGLRVFPACRSADQFRLSPVAARTGEGRTNARFQVSDLPLRPVRSALAAAAHTTAPVPLNSGAAGVDRVRVGMVIGSGNGATAPLHREHVTRQSFCNTGVTQ
nr:Nbc6 [Streptomyces sp.]